MFSMRDAVTTVSEEHMRSTPVEPKDLVQREFKSKLIEEYTERSRIDANASEEWPWYCPA